ncbi:MAG TPA: hypothetical protein VHG08_06405 [Longimicrobium sp.]|nr:hypothetical protein [Longimicrobium sp.]
MNRPRTDHNDLARLLERSLSEEERSRAVAHLSASDDDAEVLADAAYLLRALEAEDGIVAADACEGAGEVLADADADGGAPPAAPDAPAAPERTTDGGDAKVIPLRPPSTQRARRRVSPQWLALAAVLAGVLLIPLALSRRGGDPGRPGQWASLLQNGDSLSTGWVDRERWSRSRGDGEVSADEARAARLGALLLDLQLAAVGRQAEQTRYAAGQVEALLADVPGAGGVMRTYDAVQARAGAPPRELAGLLEEGYEGVILFVDADYFAAGAWTEAAQIAAETRDQTFFRSPATRRTLDRMSGLTMPAGARAALAVIRGAGAGDAPLDWDALGDATVTLGRELWK